MSAVANYWANISCYISKNLSHLQTHQGW